MINMTKISKGFGEKLVLDEASLNLVPGDRVALIGDNGAGKTTLFRIMTGKLVADSGTVNLHGHKAGYVPQEIAGVEKTVGEFFEDTENWLVDIALERVGLDKEFGEKIANLSGGEKTRLSTARALVSDPLPDVLILDEPTNNIDLGGQKWLVEFLNNWAGIVIFASHDRHFINQVANKTVELKNGKTTLYGGNYSFYREQKEVERRTAEVKYEKYQTKKKQLEQLISHERNRAKNGLRDRRLKDNDKSLRDWKGEQVQRSAAGQLKARQTQLAKLEQPDQPEQEIQRKYTLNGEKAGLVVRAENIHKSFAQQQVLREIGLEVHGDERVHLTGPNGSGKTTLLKIILGEIEADSGEIKFGEKVKVGSLSQELDNLNDSESPLAYLDAMAMDYPMTDIYKALCGLGLTTEEIKRPIGQLSRGQKTKVALARLLLGSFNLIVLDEPTNHLEIKTREAIERTLTNFNGAILFSSHDRYFVDALAPDQTLSLR